MSGALRASGQNDNNNEHKKSVFNMEVHMARFKESVARMGALEWSMIAVLVLGVVLGGGYIASLL